MGDATVQRHILHFVRDWKRNLSTTLRSKNEKLSVSCWNVAKTGNKNTLIICGPPGIGKTVSIPVFLQHVGFQVHYVSAIEENSCETLQSKIEAFRNKSCLFSNPLPPCIVLDDVVFAAGHTHVDKCIKLLVDNGKRGSSSTDSFKYS